MNGFLKLLSLSTLLLIFIVGCSDSEDTGDLTLSISPLHNLAFSAAAIESIDVQVNTNQPHWDATSDQDWCLVVKTKGKFIVQAIQNTSVKAPAKATITVSAGRAKKIKIDVTQAGVGADLSIIPGEPISLSSDGSREVELEVVTNQPSWEASSNQSWCSVVRRGLSGIAVKASANAQKTPRIASITICAGNAANVTIVVTQHADGEGSMIDDGKSIWDDTHWRIFSLLGKPLSVKYQVDSREMLLEFSPSGRLTYEGHPDLTSYSCKLEYDAKDRLSSVRHSEGGVSEVFSYEYGSHAKYIPSLANLYGMHNGINILSRGISAISYTDSDGVVSRFEFRVAVKEVLSDFPYGGKFKATYSNTDLYANYPSSSVLTTMTSAVANSAKYTFKYGTNYKYSEVTYDSGNGEVVTTKYNPVETIYLLPIREEYLSSAGESVVIMKEYNSDFQLAKSFDGTTTYIYGDYRVDSYGNWVERKINGVVETRTIEYY